MRTLITITALGIGGLLVVGYVRSQQAAAANRATINTLFG